MANERFPNDPFDPKPRDDDFGRASRLDNEVQPDPVLQEGRASTGRVALFAVAIALVLAAIFYGLNNTTINHAGTERNKPKNRVTRQKLKDQERKTLRQRWTIRCMPAVLQSYNNCRPCCKWKVS